MIQRSLLISAILLLSGTLAWLLLVWQPEDGKSSHGELPPAPRGGAFTLDSYRGEVSLNEFHGKLVLLYFGYTWCPDICPTNLTLIGTVLDQLSAEERSRVQGIFISVDPARDNVERLKEYVEYFHPSLVGLTGSESVIAEVTKRYGAAYQIHKEGDQDNYVVDHTADTYLIDPQGRLVETIPHGASVEVLLNAVRARL
jgi:protein SCO1/2